MSEENNERKSGGRGRYEGLGLTTGRRNEELKRKNAQNGEERSEPPEEPAGATEEASSEVRESVAETEAAETESEKKSQGPEARTETPEKSSAKAESGSSKSSKGKRQALGKKAGEGISPSEIDEWFEVAIKRERREPTEAHLTVSDRHADLLDKLRTQMRQEYSYSRRELSRKRLTEAAIEMLYEMQTGKRAD